jgi:hypothetical protein
VPAPQPVKELVPAGAPAAEGAANGAAPAAGPAPVPMPVQPPVVQIPPPGFAQQHPHQRPGQPVAPQTPPSMTLLYIWILLFGFVGTQLAWTLRPFFGSPDKDFSLYRDIDGNFYAEIFRTIADLF